MTAPVTVTMAVTIQPPDATPPLRLSRPSTTEQGKNVSHDNVLTPGATPAAPQALSALRL